MTVHLPGIGPVDAVNLVIVAVGLGCFAVGYGAGRWR